MLRSCVYDYVMCYMMCVSTDSTRAAGEGS